MAVCQQDWWELKSSRNWDNSFHLLVSGSLCTISPSSSFFLQTLFWVRGLPVTLGCSLPVLHRELDSQRKGLWAKMLQSMSTKDAKFLNLVSLPLPGLSLHTFPPLLWKSNLLWEGLLSCSLGSLPPCFCETAKQSSSVPKPWTTMNIIPQNCLSLSPVFYPCIFLSSCDLPPFSSN